MYKIENRIVDIGDQVCFKLDVEQDGVITKISEKDNKTIATIEGDFDGILSSDNFFEIDISNCWLPLGYKTKYEENLNKKRKFITKIEGKKAYFGDQIFFKCDVEQYGKLKSAYIKNGELMLILTNKDGFDGHYIGGEVEIEIELKYCSLVD